MRVRSLSTVAACCFTLGSLSAQTPAPATAQARQEGPVPPLVVLAALHTDCPVGFDVRRVPQGAVRQVDGNPRLNGVALRMILGAMNEQHIAQARVTVTGIAGAHAIPVNDYASSSATDTSESFTIGNTEAPRAQLVSTVYTRELTGIRFVQLDELRYANGTVWRQTQGAVCRVSPSKLMPVNATR